jgi:hypothetical protein
MPSRPGGYPFRESLAEVKANLAILEACPGPHDFQEIKDGKAFGAKWRCATLWRCRRSPGCRLVHPRPGTRGQGAGGWLTLPCADNMDEFDDSIAIMHSAGLPSGAGCPSWLQSSRAFP